MHMAIPGTLAARLHCRVRLDYDYLCNGDAWFRDVLQLKYRVRNCPKWGALMAPGIKRYYGSVENFLKIPYADIAMGIDEYQHGGDDAYGCTCTTIWEYDLVEYQHRHFAHLVCERTGHRLSYWKFCEWMYELRKCMEAPTVCPPVYYSKNTILIREYKTDKEFVLAHEDIPLIVQPHVEYRKLAKDVRRRRRIHRMGNLYVLDPYLMDELKLSSAPLSNLPVTRGYGLIDLD